jgi:hypothetical protein
MIELLSYFVSGAQTNTRAPQPQSSRRKPRLKTMKQELEKKDQRPKTRTYFKTPICHFKVIDSKNSERRSEMPSKN